MSEKTSDKRLLSCPFCGGEAKINIFLGNYCVTCTECMGAIFPSRGMKKEEAIKAWNTRKPMETIVERLEEEIKKCDRNYREYMCDFYVEGMAAARSTKYGMNKAIEIIKEEGGM